jgi:hypothetical protein
LVKNQREGINKMGATFSRLKTWVHEKLKASDLNAEFNNILTNLTPAGIDDLSVSAGEMQGTAAPFPGSVLSQATSLAGEIQRLRYQLCAILGTTYWYEAPASTVLAMAANISGIAQYILDTATPTYISGTSFSVTTDRTAEFVAGRRIQVVVTAGTLYGTIVSSSAGGSPTVTTVVLLMDSGALDSGLSSFSLGMITPANNSMPILVPEVKTDDYTVAIGDNRKILIANKASAIGFTLGAYSTFPVGWTCKIRNIGAGTLTITGTVEGVTNPTLVTGDEVTIYNSGSNGWRGLPLKDAAASVASLRTLGTGAAQACPGNDSRLSDARIANGGNADYATNAGFANNAQAAVTANIAAASDTVDGFHFRFVAGMVGESYYSALEVKIGNTWFQVTLGGVSGWPS